MDEYEYEAVPSAEARRIVRGERSRAYLAHGATIAAMMAAGAVVVAIGAQVLFAPSLLTLLAPTALVAFVGGYWLGRRRRTAGKALTSR